MTNYTNTTISTELDALSVGRTSSNPFVDVFASRDPTPNDINYPIQKKWLNTLDNTFWELEALPGVGGVTTAVWVKIASESLIESLTGNTGGPVFPIPADPNNINVVGDGNFIVTSGNPGTATLTITAGGGLTTLYTEDTGTATPMGGNLNVVGGPGISTSGSGNTITITNLDTTYYSLTPYIVGPDVHSQFTTIGAAIAQAVIDGVSAGKPANIYVKPQSGGYTENNTLPDGVNIIGFNQSTVVNGTFTVNTATLNSSLSGLTLNTNGSYFIVVSGAAASTLTVRSCALNCTNHTGINFTSTDIDAEITLIDCYGGILNSSDTLYSMTSPGSISFLNTFIGNELASIVPSNNSEGTASYYNSTIGFPISTSGTGVQGGLNSTISTPNTTCITTAGTSQNSWYNCVFASGSAPGVSVGAGTTQYLSNCSLTGTGTTGITGAGTLFFGGLVFSNSMILPINVTTGIPLNANASWQLIQTQRVSAAASVSFTTGLTYYNQFVVTFSALVPDTNTEQLEMFVSTDGGATYLATGYLSAQNVQAYNTGTLTNGNSTTNFIFGSNYSNTPTDQSSGVLNLTGTTSGEYFKVNGNATILNSGVPYNCIAFGVGPTSATAVNAIQFKFQTGNIANGIFTLYGVAI